MRASGRGGSTRLCCRAWVSRNGAQGDIVPAAAAALRERAHLFRRCAARKKSHDRKHTDDRTVFAKPSTLLNSDPARPPNTFRVGGDMPFHSQ